MEEQVATAWVGVDVGKCHRWLCLIDDAGTTLRSTKVVNDETVILDAIAGVLARAEAVVWGVDVTGPCLGYWSRCWPLTLSGSGTCRGGPFTRWQAPTAARQDRREGRLRHR